MAQGDEQERINILSKFYNMQGGDNKKSHRGRRLGVPWGLVHGILLNGVVSTGFTEKDALNTDVKARKLATKTPEGRAFSAEKIVSTKAVE